MRYILFLLLTFLLPFSAAAQSTERDSLTAFLEDNLSSAGRIVTVTGFRGAFSSRAEMDQLTIADAQGVWLTLNGLVLDWNRLALLRGRVEIAELVANEVIVARGPMAEATPTPAPEATGFSLPELPVSVSIGKLAAARLVLEAPLLGQRVEAVLDASVQLEGGEGQADISLTRTGAGPAGRLALTASYANATRNLVIDLEAEEGSGGVAATLLDLPGTPSVTLGIKGAGPLEDFSADLLLATDGAPRLSGSVALTGVENGAQGFAVDLGGDLAPLFLPDYAEFFGPSVRLRAAGQRSALGRMDLNALTVETRALSLDGSALIAADGLPERFALVGRLGLPDGSPILLPLSGESETRVNSADLRLNFDASLGDGWSAAVNLTGLDRPDLTVARAKLNGSGRISRRAGAAAVVGGTLTFEATEMLPQDAGLALALGRDVSGSTTFDWQPGGGAGLRIGRLTLDGAGYSLKTSGRIGDLASGFEVTGTLQARHDDLSRLALLANRPLAGSAVMEAKGTGSLLGGTFDGDATITGTNLETGIAELDRLLRGQSVLALSAARDSTGLVLRGLDLTAQQLVAKLSGNLASTGSTLAADLAFSDLAVLGPAYRGSLRAEASFKGTPEAGRLVLSGVARDLKIGVAQADGLLSGESRVALDVNLSEGRYQIGSASIRNPQITLQADGYYDAAGSDLKAALSLADLGPIGRGFGGSLRADLHATGTLQSGRLELDGAGRNLALGQPQANRLLAGTTTVTAAVNLRDARLEVESLRLANPQLTATASGSVTEALRQIRFDARLVNLALLIPEFPGALTLNGTAQENGNGFVLDLTGQGPGGIDARVAGRLAQDLRSADLAINGTAQAALANVFLGSRSLSGQTRFDLRLNGPLALSSLSGQASLSGGRIADPALPFGLQDLSATVNLAGNTARITGTAAATSGGQVTVEGSVGLAAPFAADLSIGLGRLVVKDPDLYEAQLGGALTLRGPLRGGALLAGTVTIREAEIRVPSTGLGGAGAIPDLRHINEPAAVRTTRSRAGLLGKTGADRPAGSGALQLDLTINAPSRIFLRGRGIDAELGGSVTLRGTTAAVVPTGAFDLIRGRLDILGKRLTLSSARLVLQGDLVPYLEIIASNDSDGITTSVVIEGRADEPEVRFTSSPELPQEEVLARLLFGRGLDKISALQAVQLASAVAALAGRGGEGIVSRLRTGFGLDDLDFRTDADGNAALTAGKYISRNVYTEVEVGQDGQSKINLNLDIRPGVTVRGSVGGNGSTGIGVFVEKDY